MKKLSFLVLIEEKYNSYKVADDRKVYQQVPYQMVVTKSLFGVEPCAQRVEDASGSDKR